MEQSKRIQTSILNSKERDVLIWLAVRMPRWVTSDRLTVLGLFGAFLCGLGFFLTNYSIYWLWLSCVGLAVNWFGDSLDGTLARVHKQERPLYGYYLDHNADTITEAFMFIGAGLSPLMHLSVALLCYSAYLALTVYVSINAHLKKEFKLTYYKLGPTEFRAIMVIVNLLLMYIPILRSYEGQIVWFGDILRYNSLDIIGVCLYFILCTMFLISFLKDLKWYSNKDPLPSSDKTQEGKEHNRTLS